MFRRFLWLKIYDKKNKKHEEENNERIENRLKIK